MDELVSVSGWCYGLFPDGRGPLSPTSVTDELVERPVIQGDLAEIANSHSGYKLKNRSLVTTGRALNVMAAAALILLSTGASALGLGRVNVQSVLGEALRAEIEVTSLNAEEASSLKVSLASPEAFKASGVEYNAVLVGATVTLSRRADGRPVLVLSSDKVVQEPFIDVIVEFQWSTGHLTRSYTLLIDPPGRNTAAQPGTTATAPVFASPPPAARLPAQAPAPAPQVALAPPPAPLPAPVPAPAARTPKPSPAPRPTTAPKPAPVEKPSPPPVSGGAGEGSIKVNPGDTLTSLAAGNKPSGVSLDQMLVSLYRNNPSAFIDDNMNRMKSGVTLSVPSADTAKQLSNEEAHQVIQAQSVDFAAYRHRLATGVTTVHTDEGKRAASGKVEAKINDQKTASAPPAPDKLTLSRGSAKPGNAPSEVKDSKETLRKAEAARVAELSRNVAELKKLADAKTAPAPAVPAARAPAPAPVMPAITAHTPAPAPVVAPKPAPIPPPAPVPAPKPAPVPVPVPVPAPIPSTPSPAVAPVAAPAAPVVASAPIVAASAPAPVVVPSAPVRASAPVRPPVAAPAPAETSFLDSLLEPPYIFPGLAGLVVLLGGFLFWRRRQGGDRNKFSGETSFIESKIQPDSFFGASGGQRVDTRDGAANSASSSLNYSLSQLDAIGDVDPVAEADVYLAYGRDLQAEEILKEAQRSDPDRLAIRTKLLEVYAKRADLKTFETQARQLQGLTNGQGEDWAKAQELGRQIDPTNPLYTEGGEYAIVDTDPMPLNPLGEDPEEMTLTRPPVKADGQAEFSSTDLPIDFDHDEVPTVQPGETGPTTRSPAHTEPINMDSGDTARQPHQAAVHDVPFEVSDFDLEPGHVEVPTIPPAPAPAAAKPAPAHAAGEPSIDFDFGDLSLDLDKPAPGAEASDESVLPDLDLGGAHGDSEPMARKIELADEFRRIGDHEGARELLEEVVGKADGPLKARAQTMLDALG
jgi:pilus assembly protein FimV